MSDDYTSVTVQLLGRAFAVKCRAEERESLQKAVEFLNKKMLEVQKKMQLSGFERIAAITALNLSNEMLRDKDQKNDLLSKVNEKLSGLQEKVDEALHHKQVEFSYELD